MARCMRGAGAPSSSKLLMEGQHQCASPSFLPTPRQHRCDLLLPSGPIIYRVFLLPDCLELDLSFAPASKFGAGGSTFRLLFREAAELPYEPPTPAPAESVSLRRATEGSRRESSPRHDRSTCITQLR